MKKVIAMWVALVLICGGCDAEQQTIPRNSEMLPPSQPASAEPSDIPISYDGVALQFVSPDMPYDVLCIAAMSNGYVVVYQEEMPDEFNKIYSLDSIFYAVRTQIFDSKGAYVETIDSQRRNANKIEHPIHRLQTDGETISFEIWKTNRVGKTEATCFTFAVTAEGTETLGYNPNNYLYSQREFCELAADGDIQLQYTSVYNHDEGKESLLFRLAAPEGDARELLVTFFDASFQNALYNTAHGADEDDGINDQKNPLYKLSLSVDAASQSAQLSNGKIDCRLNFSPQSQGCDVTRRYTNALLRDWIVSSSDGTRAVYNADVRNYFESVSGCDYVLQNENGEITFLFAGSDIDQLYFLENDRIWANTFSGMAFYDGKTGKLVENQPAFDFGQQQSPYNKAQSGISRIVVGTAVDTANRRLLVAHRPYTFGSGMLRLGNGSQTDQLPVSLTVLDWDGRALFTVETEMTMWAFGKFFINTVTLKANGDGTVTLCTEGQKPVTVGYI